MVLKRVIPCLLLKGKSLVKTIKFKSYNYIGDPINTVRIFNELEVDELCFLDICASRENREPNFKLLEDISNECFMPLSFGGGINNLKIAKRVLEIGYEKVIINSNNFKNLDLISQIANSYGVQCVVGGIDVKTNFWNKKLVFSPRSRKNTRFSPVEWAKVLVERGVGEVLLTSVDLDGSWNGYDLKLAEEIANAVSVPVIINGGAGSVFDINKAFEIPGIQATAVGSLVVYQKKGMGVLVNFPDKEGIKI